MDEIIIMAIGLGLLVNLLLSELLGLIAGGMVVAGYVGLNMDLPADVALTIVAAAVTFGVVRGLSLVAILYGRRMFAATVLVGFLVGVGLNMACALLLPQAGVGVAGTAAGVWGLYRVIGFIIPGLIAVWMERQGVITTICSLLVGAAVVRLVLVLIIGHEIGPVTEVFLGPGGAP